VLKVVEFPWPLARGRAAAQRTHGRQRLSARLQAGEAILLEARVMAVADVIEAMSSLRPYRAALGIEAALSEIERGRRSEYDAEVTDACLKLFRERHYQLRA
jgi:HD-GYP domain-containing protein (c-di-GMP phosphodiesterase class II)